MTRREGGDAIEPAHEGLAPNATGGSVEHDDARGTPERKSGMHHQRVRIGRHAHEKIVCQGLQVDSADERPVGSPPLLHRAHGLVQAWRGPGGPPPLSRFAPQIGTYVWALLFGGTPPPPTEDSSQHASHLLNNAPLGVKRASRRSRCGLGGGPSPPKPLSW